MTTVQRQNGQREQMKASEVEAASDTTRWFTKEVQVPQQAQELLQNYSGIPEAEVAEHVTKLRQKAFATWPYPCIGHLRFLDLTATQHPDYPEILRRLKAGQTYLDVGCCFGQDIRKLLYDGAPSSDRLFGVDIEPAFFDLGKELFKDGDRLQSKFFAVNMVQTRVDELQSAIDVVSTQSIFHLFGRDEQKLLAKNLVSVSKQGTLLAGRQIGAKDARHLQGLSAGTQVFAHNSESWRSLWQEVGEQTGTRWEVSSCLETDAPDRVKRQAWYTPDMTIISYSVTRVA